MEIHTVESTPVTVRSGVLDPGAPAVAKIESGDVVSYPYTWTNWNNELAFGMSFEELVDVRRRNPGNPFPLLGPVEVAGAEPGDVIECRLTALRTRDWGCNASHPGSGALRDDFTEPYMHYFRFDEERRTAAYAQGTTIPLAPFLGITAVEPAGDEPVGALLAGPHGGNLVLRELTVGSSLFLPVAKPGGRVWVGDVHAAQGDGMVDQTGIKSAAEDLRIRYDLHKSVALDGPLAETETHWIGFGFAADLDEALLACLRGLVAWLPAAAGITAAEAYALCGMAVSFRITQYADQRGSSYSALPPKTVHGMVPKDVFPPEVQERIGAWLRPSAR